MNDINGSKLAIGTTVKLLVDAKRHRGGIKHVTPKGAFGKVSYVGDESIDVLFDGRTITLYVDKAQKVPVYEADGLTLKEGKSAFISRVEVMDAAVAKLAEGGAS